MEWLSEFGRRLLVVTSRFWPLLVIALVGIVIQVAVHIRRRMMYSEAVSGWRLVDAELLETRSVTKSHVDEDGKRRYQSYYAGKVKFDDGVRMICVPEKWHKMVGKACGMQHRLVCICDGVDVKVLVNPADSSNAVAPKDFDTVLGEKGIVWQLGFAMTLFGSLAFVVVFLMMIGFV